MDAVRALRAATASALRDVLTNADGKSESIVADEWHEALNAIPCASATGWYTPPPRGLIVAFARPPAFQRVRTISYRPVETWPSDRAIMNEETLVFAYASRVDVRTGALGDFDCTVYRGGDAELREHIGRVLGLTLEIAQQAEPGMPLCELHRRASNLINSSGYSNDVYSNHGGTTENIGHTLPWSTGDYDDAARAVVTGNDENAFATLVSKRRRFVSATDDFEITDGMAFTIEPRLSTPELPTVGFHTVVSFESGERKVTTGFDDLFDLFGMDWAKPYLHET